MLVRCTVLALSLLLFSPCPEAGHGTNAGERSESVELLVTEFIHSENRKYFPMETTKRSGSSPHRPIVNNTLPVITLDHTDQNLIIKIRRLLI